MSPTFGLGLTVSPPLLATADEVIERKSATSGSGHSRPGRASRKSGYVPSGSITTYVRSGSITTKFFSSAKCREGPTDDIVGACE
jgi:hypothetical protein